MKDKTRGDAGTRDWLAQRLTSIVLPPLGLWFVFALATAADLSAQAMLAWVANPLHASLLAALILITCWHMLLGLHVVVEDYVQAGALRTVTLLLLNIVTVALAVAGVWAVLEIALR